MSRLRLALLALLSAWLAGPAALQAASPPDKAIFGINWIARSTTAMGVTGDARLTSDSITFDNRVTFPLRFVEEVVPKTPVDFMKQIPSFSLYEVLDPTPRVIRQGTGLCGGINAPERVHYLAIGHNADRDILHVIAYRSETPPADINFSVKGFCGGYNYFAE
ncbi:MAG: hypothetical protein ACK4Z4_04880 [Ferrovibrio sp.]